MKPPSRTRKRNSNSPAAKAFKKVKAKSIAKLKKDVWTIFSKYIRARDKYTCYTCGKRYNPDGSYEGNIGKGSMHAGHFISRRMNSTFFDEMNVHAQCLFCNMWDYGATGPYAERLMKDYGLQRFKDLLARSKMTKQWQRGELEKMLETYKAKYEELISP